MDGIYRESFQMDDAATWLAQSAYWEIFQTLYQQNSAEFMAAESMFRDISQKREYLNAIAEERTIPVIGLVNIDELSTDISRLFCMPSWEADILEEIQQIDMDTWLAGRNLNAGGQLGSIPHQACSHIIVSDDTVLLEQWLSGAITTLQIMINGSKDSLELFTRNVQNEKHVLVLPYTGGAADLVVRY